MDSPGLLPRAQRLGKEILDDRSVVLTCERHGIQAKPVRGCKSCWMVYYTKWAANMAPSERLKSLTELQRIVHSMVEQYKKGKWDFVPGPLGTSKTTKE